jgi:DNA-binding NarL/FixJ family response regulator
MNSVFIVADSGREMARLTATVNAVRGLEIVRHANGRTSVARLVAGHRPSLVLIGELTPQHLTLERLTEVRMACPDTKVVVLAADSGARWLARALRAGAAAVVPGQLDARALGTVLEEVLATDTAGAAAIALAA